MSHWDHVPSRRINQSSPIDYPCPEEYSGSCCQGRIRLNESRRHNPPPRPWEVLCDMLVLTLLVLVGEQVENESRYKEEPVTIHPLNPGALATG